MHISDMLRGFSGLSSVKRRILQVLLGLHF